jgi:gliding motility-associated-like protein
MFYETINRVKYACKFLLFFLLIFSTRTQAQINISPGVSATTLINSLVGSSMTVTNVTLNCPTNAYGTFSNGSSTNLGLNTGILLTTGNASIAQGPNNSSSAGFCNGTQIFDPQLQSIDPQATRDPCILEFDIIPQCNTLTLHFVFGSEEYPEFVSSGFNDAFGFWITGPGPGCIPNFYNNTNVATLPNNITTVSIDHVNPTTNSQYYVNNTGGTTIQYDGFTTVLTRNVLLCPCQTYHWKIAIADAGDCIYDSGVFLDFLACSTVLTSTASSTPASCAGCNGTATANAFGSGPFTYNWQPGGQTTQTATGLCPGTYTCTVDDAVSCAPPITVAVVVGAVTVPLTSTTTQTNVTCTNACNGIATVTPTSGGGPYTYSWSSGGNAATETGLCPGVYTCTFTDASGCTGTASVTITQPPLLTATSSGTNITCFGGSNGTASASPSGGSPGYLYSWAPSGGNGSLAIGLAAGTYTCTVTDMNGCSTTTSVTLTEPTAVTATSVGTNISCFGGTNGTATVTAGGGTGGYTYSWAPSGGSAATATGLVAGSYTCTVTDNAGCATTTSITLTEPPLLTIAASGSPALCFNSCDGQLSVVPNGGTTPYSYSWSSGCITANCNNVCAGTYTITVTDANGCNTNSPVTITQPTTITQNLSSTPSNCNAASGTATTVVNGGTGPYSYNWMPGNGNAALYSNITYGQYTVTVTDANGCVSIDSIAVANTSGLTLAPGPVVNVSCFGLCDGSATATANGSPPYSYAWSSGGTASTESNLCIGSYTCTITDADGCWNTISFTITEPAVLSVTTPAPTPVICNGATTNLSATAAGGTTAYSYLWMPGNHPGNAPSVAPTATTTYTVTVTDANGCTATATELVTVNPTPVAAYSGSATSGCAPLDVDFTDLSTIGAPGVIVAWSWEFGDNSTSTLQNPSHQYPNAGTYDITLTVTTADGCVSTIVLNNYITVFPNPVAGFSASPQPTTIMEPVITFADQSTGATSWLWNFGDEMGSTSTTQNPVFEFRDTLCYTVQQIVYTSNSCSDTAELPVCILHDWALYIPNAFTPNGDGLNDVFMPSGIGVEPDTYEMWVFDRWGNLVFYTDQIYKGWDGKAKENGKVVQLDTYVYKVLCTDVLGIEHRYIGKVSLVR